MIDCAVYLVPAPRHPYWKHPQYLSLLCLCQDATYQNRRRSQGPCRGQSTFSATPLSRSVGVVNMAPLGFGRLTPPRVQPRGAGAVLVRRGPVALRDATGDEEGVVSRVWRGFTRTLPKRRDPPPSFYHNSQKRSVGVVNMAPLRGRRAGVRRGRMSEARPLMAAESAMGGSEYAPNSDLGDGGRRSRSSASYSS